MKKNIPIEHWKVALGFYQAEPTFLLLLDNTLLWLFSRKNSVPRLHIHRSSVFSRLASVSKLTTSSTWMTPLAALGSPLCKLQTCVSLVCYVALKGHSAEFKNSIYAMLCFFFFFKIKTMLSCMESFGIQHRIIF